jgi:hypothetical protein
MTSRASTLGLALVSAGALLFEVALTRLFAIQQFYHFAFVVVSLAVMGTAASGVLLAARPRHPPLAALAAAFACVTVAAYLVINVLPFDSYSLAWDWRQVGVLCLYFLMAAAPFLLAGWVTGACLAAAGPSLHRPYAANLVGAGLGSLGTLLALNHLTAEATVFFAAALGSLAACCFAARPLPRLGAGLLSLLLFLLSWLLPPVLWLQISPYKPLASARLAPMARTTVSLWSASTRLDAVEGGSVHVFPGLSLNAAGSLPPQAAVFLDGEGPLPITSLAPDDPAAAELAGHMPAALAYRLRPAALVLLLDPGAGLDASLALALGAAHVTLPTDEPLVMQVLAGPYASFSRDLLHQPRLSLLPRSSRGTLRLSQGPYDVVQFALSDTYHPVTSGAFSLTEDYLLTVQAFSDAYASLDEDGLLVVTRWLQTPPSESARAFATLLEALDRSGVQNPAGQVLAYRTMRTATLIASRRPFSDGELAVTRSFLEENGYDPILLPDLQPEELNRHNRLPSDDYHTLFAALLADRDATQRLYDFNLRPPTDDQPFFFHFFRWRQTPELLARLGQTWQPFGGSGYLVLLALLGLMVVLGVPLALAPLALLHRGRVQQPVPGRSRRAPRFLAYFACLGAGYLLVELPLIQRATLLLDRPSIALAVVLFTLLLSSGLGSLLSPRIPLRPSLLALIACLIVTTVGLPAVIRIALPWSLTIRLALTVLMLSPLGALMGVPFASGLRQAEARSPGLIPWAWAVNGAVSGVSGVLAALLSLEFGFTAVLAVGALAYACAWAAAPRRD